MSTSCDHGGIISLHVMTEYRHPSPLHMWVHETCNGCGSQRVAEHEYIGSEDEDIRTVAATPWRSADPTEYPLRTASLDAARCSRCGCPASDHVVDDEERRGCVECECTQYEVGG